MRLFNFVRRELPDAGAMQYAAIPQLQNPLFTLLGGATPTRQQIHPLQPEQVYYNQAQTMQGLPGIVAGQMALQSLIDTRGVSGAEG